MYLSQNLRKPLRSDQLNDIRKLFPTKPEIDFVSFALTPENDKACFYATNTVVLELKSGANTSDFNKVLAQHPVSGKKESYGMITFKTKDVGEAFKISHELLQSGTVKWVQPNFIEKLKVHSALAEPWYQDGKLFQLRDSSQFGINAELAWKLSKGCRNIKVAVHDKGLPVHPELPNHRVDLSFSADNERQDALPYEDDHNHGLGCAAIIGAAHDGEGMAGVAPNCELFGVRLGLDLVWQNTDLSLSEEWRIWVLMLSICLGALVLYNWLLR